MVETQQPLIHLHEINKYYQVGQEPLHVLRDISLDIYSGQFVSVMGPSGSGKSTLINVMGFLDRDYSGVYQLNGDPVTALSDDAISRLRNQMVGFIFQDFNLIDAMTVRQNIQLPALYAGLTSRQTSARVDECLDKVGLLHKANNYPYELSGGQKQRVAIARALMNRPQLIIADEPTGALDTKTSQVIMNILAELNRDGVTILLVTHDPNLQEFASRHIVIIDGQVQEVAADEAVALIHRFNLIAQEAVEEELNAIQ